MPFFKNLFNTIFGKTKTAKKHSYSSVGKTKEQESDAVDMKSPHESRTINESAKKHITFSRSSERPGGPPMRSSTQSARSHPGTTADHAPASKVIVGKMLKEPLAFTEDKLENNKE